MDREIIELDNQQWQNVACEEYFEINGVEIEIKVVTRKHVGSGRHTESYFLVFKRISDGKFFGLNYETSVKDSMGWEECNYGSTKAREVFPKIIETIIYE